MGQAYKNLKARLAVLFGKKPPFKSAGEVQEAARRLIASLETAGFSAAAGSVREGFSSLNGLTDGWALFLGGLEKARELLPPEAGAGDRKILEELIAAARLAVYR